MSTFTLLPDATDDQAPQRALVEPGLAPMADIPAKAAKGPDTPPVYTVCGCGQMVLTGKTVAGQLVALDTSIATYCVRWTSGTPTPTLCESSAYPVHMCKETAE